MASPRFTKGGALDRHVSFAVNLEEVAPQQQESDSLLLSPKTSSIILRDSATSDMSSPCVSPDSESMVRSSLSQIRKDFDVGRKSSEETSGSVDRQAKPWSSMTCFIDNLCVDPSERGAEIIMAQSPTTTIVRTGKVNLRDAPGQKFESDLLYSNSHDSSLVLDQSDPAGKNSKNSSVACEEFKEESEGDVVVNEEAFLPQDVDEAFLPEDEEDSGAAFLPNEDEAFLENPNESAFLPIQEISPIQEDDPAGVAIVEGKVPADAQLKTLGNEDDAKEEQVERRQERQEEADAAQMTDCASNNEPEAEEILKKTIEALADKTLETEDDAGEPMDQPEEELDEQDRAVVNHTVQMRWGDTVEEHFLEYAVGDLEEGPLAEEQLSEYMYGDTQPDDGLLVAATSYDKYQVATIEEQTEYEEYPPEGDAAEEQIPDYGDQQPEENAECYADGDPLEELEEGAAAEEPLADDAGYNPEEDTIDEQISEDGEQLSANAADDSQNVTKEHKDIGKDDEDEPMEDTEDLTLTTQENSYEKPEGLHAEFNVNEFDEMDVNNEKGESLGESLGCNAEPTKGANTAPEEAKEGNNLFDAAMDEMPEMIAESCESSSESTTEVLQKSVFDDSVVEEIVVPMKTQGTTTIGPSAVSKDLCSVATEDESVVTREEIRELRIQLKNSEEEKRRAVTAAVQDIESRLKKDSLKLELEHKQVVMKIAGAMKVASALKNEFHADEEFGELKTLKSSLGNLLKNQKATIESLQASVAEKDNEVTELKSQVAQSCLKEKEMQSTLSVAERTLISVKAELNSVRAKSKNMEASERAAIEARDNAKQTISELHYKLLHAEGSLAAAHDALVAAQKAQQNMDELERSRTEVIAERDELNALVKELQLENKQMRTLTNDQSKKIVEKETSILELKEQIQQLEESRDNEIKSRESLRQVNMDLESVLQQQKACIEDKERAMEEMKNEIRGLLHSVETDVGQLELENLDVELPKGQTREIQLLNRKVKSLSEESEKLRTRLSEQSSLSGQKDSTERDLGPSFSTVPTRNPQQHSDGNESDPAPDADDNIRTSVTANDKDTISSGAGEGDEVDPIIAAHSDNTAPSTDQDAGADDASGHCKEEPSVDVGTSRETMTSTGTEVDPIFSCSDIDSQAPTSTSTAPPSVEKPKGNRQDKIANSNSKGKEQTQIIAKPLAGKSNANSLTKKSNNKLSLNANCFGCVCYAASLDSENSGSNSIIDDGESEKDKEKGVAKDQKPLEVKTAPSEEKKCLEDATTQTDECEARESLPQMYRTIKGVVLEGDDDADLNQIEAVLNSLSNLEVMEDTACLEALESPKGNTHEDAGAIDTLEDQPKDDDGTGTRGHMENVSPRQDALDGCKETINQGFGRSGSSSKAPTDSQRSTPRFSNLVLPRSPGGDLGYFGSVKIPASPLTSPLASPLASKLESLSGQFMKILNGPDTEYPKNILEERVGMFKVVMRHLQREKDKQLREAEQEKQRAIDEMREMLEEEKRAFQAERDKLEAEKRAFQAEHARKAAQTKVISASEGETKPLEESAAPVREDAPSKETIEHLGKDKIVGTIAFVGALNQTAGLSTQPTQHRHAESPKQVKVTTVYSVDSDMPSTFSVPESLDTAADEGAIERDQAPQDTTIQTFKKRRIDLSEDMSTPRANVADAKVAVLGFEYQASALGESDPFNGLEDPNDDVQPPRLHTAEPGIQNGAPHVDTSAELLVGTQENNDPAAPGVLAGTQENNDPSAPVVVEGSPDATFETSKPPEDAKEQKAEATGPPEAPSRPPEESRATVPGSNAKRQPKPTTVVKPTSSSTKPQRVPLHLRPLPSPTGNTGAKVYKQPPKTGSRLQPNTAKALKTSKQTSKAASARKPTAGSKAPQKRVTSQPPAPNSKRPSSGIPSRPPTPTSKRSSTGIQPPGPGSKRSTLRPPNQPAGRKTSIQPPATSSSRLATASKGKQAPLTGKPRTKKPITGVGSTTATSKTLQKKPLPRTSAASPTSKKPQSQVAKKARPMVKQQSVAVENQPSPSPKQTTTTAPVVVNERVSTVGRQQTNSPRRPESIHTDDLADTFASLQKTREKMTTQSNKKRAVLVSPRPSDEVRQPLDVGREESVDQEQGRSPREPVALLQQIDQALADNAEKKLRVIHEPSPIAIHPASAWSETTGADETTKREQDCGGSIQAESLSSLTASMTEQEAVPNGNPESREQEPLGALPDVANSYKPGTSEFGEPEQAKAPALQTEDAQPCAPVDDPEQSSKLNDALNPTSTTHRARVDVPYAGGDLDESGARCNESPHARDAKIVAEAREILSRSEGSGCSGAVNRKQKQPTHENEVDSANCDPPGVTSISDGTSTIPASNFISETNGEEDNGAAAFQNHKTAGTATTNIVLKQEARNMSEHESSGGHERSVLNCNDSEALESQPESAADQDSVPEDAGRSQEDFDDDDDARQRKDSLALLNQEMLAASDLELSAYKSDEDDDSRATGPLESPHRGVEPIIS